MNCVILQPSYIPWRGVFEQIYRADLFIFYDDVQYDKHGWRNRNRIKTHQGTQWLTIPVHARGAPAQHTPINQIKIDWRQPWNSKHWSTLQQAYTKAPYFQYYAPLLEDFYHQRPDLLADLTIDLTVALARELGIAHTIFLRSSRLGVNGDKTGRLVQILKLLGADRYLSGPSAQDYIEKDRFQEAGIHLEFMRYDYPEYPQLYPPFDPQVSILDLLFMTGPEALNHIVERKEA
jgi:hypothetical protein